MKQLLLVVILFLSITVNAKERRTYEQINDNTVVVRVYNNGHLQQKGLMKFHEGEWQICGLWEQLDKDGHVNMRVQYECGERLWVEKDLGDKVVRIEKKGAN